MAVSRRWGVHALSALGSIGDVIPASKRAAVRQTPERVSSLPVGSDGAASPSTNFADAVPHLLFRAAPDGRFEFLNRRFAELTGHDPVKLGVEQGWLNALHPDDTARLRDDFTAARAACTEVRSKIRLRHADGTFRWMLLVARRPDAADGDDAASWYGGASDIHAEVVAEAEVRDLNATLQERVDRQTAELSRTETRYASLFAVSKIAFAEQEMADAARILHALKTNGVTDLARHMAEHPELLTRCVAAVKTVSVNEACVRMLGFDTVDGAVDRPVERTADDIESVLLRQFEMIFYGWDNVEGRVVLIGSNGRRVPVFYSVTRLADERQLSSMIDISSQDRIEEMRLAVQEELARANRVATVGAFSASIAHELSQPIASVQMDAGTGLRLLRRDQPDIEAGIRQLERISSTIQRITTIVQHTRDQISGGQRDSQQIDLAVLARKTCDLLDREMRANGIDVTLEHDAPVMLVLGDFVDVQQILINLMNNARDAMRDMDGAGKSIAVMVRRSGGQVEVSVADRGTGIAPDDLDKLFQPFFTTKAGGIGLGLQICISAIQRLGGEMRAANRADGGAIFTFSLPAVLL